MKARRVVYAESYFQDLRSILHCLAETTSPDTAIGIVDRIETFAARLDMAAERGIARNDLGAGVRAIPFERAILIVVVEDDKVTVARVFYGGRDWEAAIRD